MKTDSLFQGKGAEHLPLNERDFLAYFPGIFESEADDWFVAMQASPFEQPAIHVFGKRRQIPRLQVYFGDPGVEYTYSGLLMKPVPWSCVMRKIKRQVERVTGAAYNAALVNAYRDGQDSVGWHADNEPEMNPLAPVASVSLGDTRLFRLKAKREKGKADSDVIAIPLYHGDLLVMPKGLQTRWLHEIPKTRKRRTLRINITFRQMMPVT